MATLTYEEALKKVTAAKTRENFMLVRFGYSNTVLLTQPQGVAFLNALSQAESLSEDYGKPKRINEYERAGITVSLMSWQEYQRIKIATLLGTTPEAIKDAEDGIVREEVPA